MATTTPPARRRVRRRHRRGNAGGISAATSSAGGSPTTTQRNTGADTIPEGKVERGSGTSPAAEWALARRTETRFQSRPP